MTFHRVGEDKKREITHSLPTIFISKRNFEKTIRFVAKHYTVILLSDYVEKYNNKKEIPTNSIIITFDDGYKDIYENAFPILKKYKVPATIFLTSSFISSKEIFWWDRVYAICKNSMTCSSLNHFPDEYYTKDIQYRLQAILAVDRKKRDQLIIKMITELQNYNYIKLQLLIEDLTQRLDSDLMILENKNKMLSWDNILELKNNGITFGSHTISHEFLHPDLAKDKIIHQVRNSKLEIEDKLENRVLAFAYPGGKISSEIKKIVRESGYKIACTQKPGINSDKEDIFALKRINIWDGTVEGFGRRFSKSLFAIQLIKNSFNFL